MEEAMVTDLLCACQGVSDIDDENYSFGIGEPRIIQRLKSPVLNLEAISTRGHPTTSPTDAFNAALDPSVVAFGDLIDQYLGRVSRAVEITNRIHEVFFVQKELLIKLKHTQKPNPTWLAEF
ncbi:unnamed protein product [Vicia faba]|uniref:Uncharacterized protein n=1 Tax=Vicia faba TaxID=3906 RepID=A0AAV0YVC5_VICFA|nr:unnamed protein product [Vicia faba]